MPTLKMDATTEQLQLWLRPSATIKEQVRALQAIGLAPGEVAKVAAVTPHALRGWATGSAKPRPKAAIKLDDLRATARMLLTSTDSEPEPERVANWLRGWNPILDARPLDVIGSNPTSVRAAAADECL